MVVISKKYADKKSYNSILHDNMTDKQKLALSLINKMERKIELLLKVIEKDGAG